MTFEEAKDCCHVRSAIYRKINPDKKYWKNSYDFEKMTPREKSGDDWEEYDPADYQPASFLMA